MRKLFAVLGVIGLALIAVLLWPRPADRGRDRFFADDSYNFETVRVLNDIAAAGGDAGEVLDTVGSIQAGDAESWYRAWTAAGDRTRALGERTRDPRGKGTALLRAHTYYRTAEFFLAPQDPRRIASFRNNVSAFYAGLDALKVSYERIVVPYGRYHLTALYYPGPAGAESRPLLVVVGGYDSTMEELYLSIGAAALQHGYSVLTYEGPGQGSVLRQQGLHMQADWEKPNSAVLDQFLSAHPNPGRIVLLGESLGGYLAPRAAAYDSRIDGVVAFDVWFDGYAIATRKVPPAVFWLRAHGYEHLLTALARRNTDPGSKWAEENGEWVLGVSGPFEVLDAFRPYSLAPVAGRITQDILLLAGTADHFVPLEQLDRERKSLVHARSVTAVVFDPASGGSLHCQIGAPSLWQATLFDWLAAKFPPSQNPAPPSAGQVR
jgi:alpha-beta hydrolase superfamily lysophospholipase